MRPIVLALDEGDLYAVQTRQSSGGLWVTGLAHREITPGLPDLSIGGSPLGGLLKDVLSDASFSGRGVTLQLPARDTFCLPLQFRPGKSESFEEALAREAQKHLPFSLEEAVLDYLSDRVTETVSQEHRVMAVATHRDSVSCCMELIRQAGYSLETVDVPISSLMRLHRCMAPSEGAPVLLCHVGSTQTTFAVTSHDALLVHHQAAWGIRRLIGRILTGLALDGGPNSARQLLSRYGVGYDQVLTGASRPEESVAFEANAKTRALYDIASVEIDELIHEFHVVITHARGELHSEGIREVCLYGEAAGILYLDRYIGDRIGLSTRIMTPDPKINLADGTAMPDGCTLSRFALALGLAMRPTSWL